MGKNEQMPMACARLTAVVTGGKGYGISHSWDGTVLTVSSDSGSSSADLVGPQGPAGAEQFVVEFRQEDDVYTADKSFAEIKAAVDKGVMVVGDWIHSSASLRGQLTGVSDTNLEFTFHSFLGADEYLILKADETVTHSVSEVGAEKIPSQVSVVKTDTTLTVNASYSGSLGGWGDQVITIELDEDDVPVSVTRDGKTTTLTWEGFDA